MIAELEQQVEEREDAARKLAEEAADAPPTAAELGAGSTGCRSSPNDSLTSRSRR